MDAPGSTSMAAADLPELLAARLKSPLPGWRVQRQFQPELGYGRYFAPIPGHARPAAVLLLLYPHQGGWHVPLTLRPDHLVDHASQISLPGGLIEPGERSPDAALRELSEELGVDPSEVELLGELSSIYLYRSNYQITPWVAVARHEPLWQPSPAEVAELLEIPLAHLVDTANHERRLHTFGPLTFFAPSIGWGTHHIWGATSLIVGELLSIVEELQLDL